MKIKEFLQKCLEQNKLWDITGIEVNSYFYHVHRIDDDVIDQDLDNETVVYAYDVEEIDQDELAVRHYQFTMAELEEKEDSIRFSYDKYIYSYEQFLKYDIN